tara:strand:+ start:9168 stop:9872 length:705 start_codon:yes stop_codon:yes gene_type:complete
MQLFYNPELDENTPKFTFPTEESKHIAKVLRKKEGDILHITNGKGFLFEAKILVPDIRKCTAEIINYTYQQQREPNLHLVVVPTKMNDRYEWFLEKATEIGVSEITPIICDHSERKIVKLDRMQKVLQSAMKQSLHYHLPKLNDTITFKEFMQLTYSDNLYIAHCEETQKVELKELLKPNENALILIGPEGDFSANEISVALEKGFSPVALGATRLRTETAAIYAAACFSIINT